jgi:transcriptional regulator with XRE-family HTH domain
MLATLNKSIIMGLGVNIILKREALGLSQASLARAVNCSQKQISAIERDNRPVSVRLLWNIAHRLGCKIDDLLPHIPPKRNTSC